MGLHIRWCGIVPAFCRHGFPVRSIGLLGIERRIVVCRIPGSSGVGSHREFAGLFGSALTLLQSSSTLTPKERRNSSHSGTHLRQTGGFFVPNPPGASRRDACVGRAANTTPFGEIRPPSVCGFEPPDIPSPSGGGTWRIPGGRCHVHRTIPAGPRAGLPVARGRARPAA